MRIITKKRGIFLIKMILLTLVISIAIPLAFGIFDEKSVVSRNIQLYSPIMFINIFPIIFLFKRTLLLKKGPFISIGLITYYILFVPLIEVFFNVRLEVTNEIFMKILEIINAGLLLTSFINLINYSFIDLLFKRRKVSRADLLITFLTYIILALVFAVIYVIINVRSAEPVFHGISRENRGLYFYFQHIYFSFITMTTLGYGDIYPIKFIGQFLVIIEVLTGIVLLNCILAIILGSGIFHFTENKIEKNTLREKELLDKIEKLEKKLGEKIDEQK